MNSFWQQSEIIVGGLLVLLFIGLLLFLSWREVSVKKKRLMEKIKQFADSAGFSYEPKGNPRTYPFGILRRYSRGTRHKLHHIFRREIEGVENFIFQDVSDSKGRNCFFAVVLRRPSANFPRFELLPTNDRLQLLQKFAKPLGMQDIDFYEDPAFSRKFLLRGEDENAIRIFFSSARREAAMNLGNWAIEGAGDWLLLWTPEKDGDNFDDLAGFLKDAMTVADSFFPLSDRNWAH